MQLPATAAEFYCSSTCHIGCNIGVFSVLLLLLLLLFVIIIIIISLSISIVVMIPTLSTGQFSPLQFLCPLWEGRGDK